MTDRTRNIRPNDDSTVGKPSTSRTIIEQFCSYTEDGRTLVFEESNDLMLAVQAIDADARTDLVESQVLVRHNIDDEGITHVYVDGPHGPGGAELAVLDEVIPALQEIRELLARAQRGL